MLATELVSDLFTPAQNANPATSIKPLAAKKQANAALPATGTSQHSAAAMTILGLLTLTGTSLFKKKEGQ
ncbi:LPXTG cell wall anchor domain-containing protein [Streptococcus equi]|uniref:LPXTG cell wall anchor domain-containing protein n=1 Tax=Streptococcus equi TaxID=1336 RepID=UPI001E608676